MRGIVLMFLFINILFYLFVCDAQNQEDYTTKWPSIGISVLVRNKAHALPYFFSCLQKLDYPTDRIYIWIHSDFNEDNSIEVIDKWVKRHASVYRGIYFTSNHTTGPLHDDEKKATAWTPKHYEHVINLRESALNFARKMWADYIFMIDADVYLTYPETLKALVNKNVTIVAPMLVSDGMYSNFWGGMTKDYYYERADDYKDILEREKRGCFKVPMVHTAVLIDMRLASTDLLTYNPKSLTHYKGPHDDIIVFAINCKYYDIPLRVCNDFEYGYVQVPLEDTLDPEDDYEQLLNVKLKAISRGTPIPLDAAMENDVQYPPLWKYNCDEIYMINLERRTERRNLMNQSFKDLGMDVKLFQAIDGRTVNLKDPKSPIKLMPNYEDPYHKRPMKAGEVGCFLSHYYIWKEVVGKKYETTLILEDDIHFIPYFRDSFLNVMQEIQNMTWDIVYIGRKILNNDEPAVSENLVKPMYSYWTLGYLISQSGARKLLAAKPLSKMLPVDEFLPIMFNQHPNATWKSFFPKRDLIAFSASPLLVHPTHYTGQQGYVSDTEDSVVLPTTPARPSPRNEL